MLDARPLPGVRHDQGPRRQHFEARKAERAAERAAEESLERARDDLDRRRTMKLRKALVGFRPDFLRFLGLIVFVLSLPWVAPPPPTASQMTAGPLNTQSAAICLISMSRNQGARVKRGLHVIR